MSGGAWITRTSLEPQDDFGTLNWFFRDFDAFLWCRSLRICLRVRRDVGAEEFAPGASIDLSLDHLGSVNLALHLASASRVFHDPPVTLEISFFRP